MKINSDNKTNFGVKVNTLNVLETTTQNFVSGSGVESLKSLSRDLYGSEIKPIGAKSYRYYAIKLGDEIMTKYPEIANATNEIKNIMSKNPNIMKQDLKTYYDEAIEKLGLEIDISI